MKKKLKTWQFEQDERETMANILKDIASSEDPETIYLDIMMPVPIIQVRSRQPLLKDVNLNITRQIFII